VKHDAGGVPAARSRVDDRIGQAADGAEKLQKKQKTAKLYDL
jgi:hypothetical protein